MSDIGFKKEGRYGISEGIKMAVEVPTSGLVEEGFPGEVVEIGV